MQAQASDSLPAQLPEGRDPSFLTSFALAYFVPYFGVHILASVPFASALRAILDHARRSLVAILARRLLGLTLDPAPTGGGDGTIEWLWLALLFTLALGLGLATRKRVWFRDSGEMLRPFLRFALASSCITYGMMKLLPPQQFGTLNSQMLGRTYGDSSPMGLLWTFMAYSPAYTCFAGAAEFAGGILLLTRRTTTLGALFLLPVLTNVFLLNLFYDVPVKQFAFHLLLVDVILLAPEARRLWSAALGPAVRPSRTHTTVTIVLAMLLLVGAGKQKLAERRVEPRPNAFTGIYQVDDPAAPWRRVLIDPTLASIESPSGERRLFFRDQSLPPDQIELVDPKNFRHRVGRFTIKQVGERYVLSGEVDGKPITQRCRRVPQFLLTRGFHLINDRPVNR
jgi:uncharacterized membrane protein YphA (DoxX/SURF4 family)